MLLVMLLPLLLRTLLPLINTWIQALMAWERVDKTKKIERQIEHKKNYEYCEFGADLEGLANCRSIPPAGN